MIIRAVDENNDWLYGKGKSDYKKNLEALKQDLKTRLQSWKNDCFFALSEGVDYNNFLDKNTKIFLDRDTKKVMLQTEGVLRINTFNSEVDVNRGYSGLANITTIYGATILTL